MAKENEIEGLFDKLKQNKKKNTQPEPKKEKSNAKEKKVINQSILLSDFRG